MLLSCLKGCSFDKQLQVILHNSSNDITSNIGYVDSLQVRLKISDLTNVDIYETLDGVTAEKLEEVEQLYISHVRVDGFNVKK